PVDRLVEAAGVGFDVHPLTEPAPGVFDGGPVVGAGDSGVPLGVPVQEPPHRARDLTYVAAVGCAAYPPDYRPHRGCAPQVTHPAWDEVRQDRYVRVVPAHDLGERFTGDGDEVRDFGGVRDRVLHVAAGVDAVRLPVGSLDVEHIVIGLIHEAG